jgi:hypothetical protein
MKAAGTAVLFFWTSSRLMSARHLARGLPDVLWRHAVDAAA